MVRVGSLAMLLGLVLSAGCGESHSSDDSSIAFDAEPDAGPDSARPDTGAPPVCGDGDLDPGESCDDGNTADGDGCDATCFREARCGDNMDDPGEVCDDGNNRSGDGCRSDCASDETCGNGIRDIRAGEQCDDGNTEDGDGCSADCRLLENCGDGTMDEGEQCDDGNLTPWDGCGTDCRVEVSMVIDTLTVGGAGVGCDYSGDGRPDNAFGAGIGGVLGMFLGDGGNLAENLTVLLDMQGLDDLSGADDPDITAAWLQGQETATAGEYVVDEGGFDLDGTPLITFEGSIASSLFAAGPEDIEIPVFIFPIEIRQSSLTATTRATAGRLSHLDDGLLCGAVPLDLLSAFPVPEDIPIIGGQPACGDDPAPPTFADLIIGGALILPPTAPDVDLDGDGLERFELERGSGCQVVVSACIDGDGTRIEGRDCLLDPRIRDGLSAGLPFTATPATIVGTGAVMMGGP